MSDNRGSGGSGLGVGAVVAALLSWTANHSVGYCILHTICGWFYVAYYLVFKWGA